MYKPIKSNQLQFVLWIGLMLFSSTTLFAQQGFSIRWDAEVGCLNYEDIRKEIPLEDISSNNCINVCQGSEVTFDLIYDASLNEVASVNWGTTEGFITSPNNTGDSVKIKWPTATQNAEVTIKITLANGTIIYQSICVAVKPKPKAYFETTHPEEHIYCSNTTVYFENQSVTQDGSQIVSSVWDFGDGNYSSASDPEHEYTSPGNYTVTLTVTDECNCTDTYKMDVKILKPSLEISCPTVTCEGATETYSLEINPFSEMVEIKCMDYKWIVEGGQIIEQSNEWIEVLWNNIDEDGFGYIYFDQSNCEVACDNMLSVRIPVVTKQATIKGGDPVICQGEQSRYSLPKWPTTEIEWFILDNASVQYPDNVILVDQRNEIAIDTENLPAGEYILKAQYTNTLQECGGKAEYNFKVAESLEITPHPESICEGEALTFSLTQNQTNICWSITKNDQTVATVNASAIDHTFITPGRYKITAITDSGCNASSYVDVFETPNITGASISGPTQICPGSAETYTFNGLTDGFEVLWEVENGTFLGPNTGENVSVVFDQYSSGPFSLSAKLVNLEYATCTSTPIHLPIEKKTVQKEIINVDNNSPADASFCASSESDFNINYLDSDAYEWVVNPSELGSVSAGQGSASATVLFNEVYTNAGSTVDSGTIEVLAKVCGEMVIIDTYNFSLTPSPSLTVNAPNSICAGEEFDITVNSTFPLTGVNGSEDLNLAFGNGQNFTGTVISPTEFIFTDIAINPVDNNLTLNYEVSIANSSCNTAVANANITVFPAPVIDISQQNGNSFCNPNDINSIFTANAEGDISALDFQWYVNGSAIPGETNPVLNLGSLSNPPFGEYYVIATNQDGCSTQSQPIPVAQDCDDPIACDSGESISFTGNWASCQNIQLTASHTGTPDEVIWKKYGNFTNTNATFTNSPSNTIRNYATSIPGTYWFLYAARYGDCVVSKLIDIEVGYEATLNYSITCNGANQYNVTLYNDSEYLPDYNGLQVTYEILNLDTNSLMPLGAESFDSAQATLPQGNYEFKLQIQQPGFPLCEVSSTVNLQTPNANFSIAQMSYCVEDTVYLTPDYPQPGATYLWEFNGGSNTLQTITPSLVQTQDNSISLTITGPYGCSDTHTISGIEVIEAYFQGDINAQNGEVLCAGATTELVYTPLPGTNYPLDYQWFFNQQEIPGASSSSYTATALGEYSLHLFDANGCAFKKTNSIYINESLPPNLSAVATRELCSGEDLQINGTLSPDNTEYRVWLQETAGDILVQDWLPGPEVNYQTMAGSPGEYLYRLEYRDITTNCTANKLFTIQVYPQYNLNVDYEILSCAPYRIRLSVDAIPGAPGYFTWSNGQIGEEIIVSHGGAYQVRYQPGEAGCSSTAQITAPKSPEEFIWIFPDGCFQYCPKRVKNNPYIIGPLPEFESYTWSLDNNSQTFPGQVEPFVIDGYQGVSTLTLENEFCSFTSNPLSIGTGRYCDRVCDIDYYIQKISLAQDKPYLYYEIYGTITNLYNHNITLVLSSPDGTYIPAHISIPANATYNFLANPIQFIPDPSFLGGQQAFSVTAYAGGKILCKSDSTFEFPPLQAKSQINLTVSPNPLDQETTVDYKIKNNANLQGGELRIYDLAGNLHRSKLVKNLEGQERFNLGSLASGQYVLVFYHQGKPIVQKLLIKK